MRSASWLLLASLCFVPVAFAGSKMKPTEQVKCLDKCRVPMEKCMKLCGQDTRCLEKCGADLSRCTQACGPLPELKEDL